MNVSKFRRALPVLLGATTTLALAGCASTVERWDAENSAAEALHSAALDEISRTAPTCNDEADCSAKWNAAQAFVQKSSAYRLQTVSSAVIQTFGPLDDNACGVAFSVTREPLGAGRYRILPATSTFYPHTCRAAADDAAILFNRTVGATPK